MLGHNHSIGIFLEKWGSPLCSSWMSCLSSIFYLLPFQRQQNWPRGVCLVDYRMAFLLKLWRRESGVFCFVYNISPVCIMCKMLYRELFYPLLLFPSALTAGLWPVLVGWHSVLSEASTFLLPVSHLWPDPLYSSPYDKWPIISRNAAWWLWITGVFLLGFVGAPMTSLGLTLISQPRL